MDDRLDRALADLHGAVAFPPTPDLRDRVAVALRQHAAGRRWAWPVPRAVGLAILGALVVLGTVAALAIALPALRIGSVTDVPPEGASPAGLASRLAFGAPFPPGSVETGIPAALGTPDEAYLLGDEEVQTLVYAAGGELPELGGSDIGFIVQRIGGRLDAPAVEKLVPEIGAEVVPTVVGGADGYWISGPPHLVRYLTPDDGTRSQATRLVGDTLVWQRGEVLYRIESALGLEATLRIAESIPP